MGIKLKKGTFKVKKNGTFVPVDVLMGSGDCENVLPTDVRINGSSITHDGVANIPMASSTVAGVTTIDAALNQSSPRPLANRVVMQELLKKVDKVAGKGLSTNDYTAEDKSKVDTLPDDLDEFLREAKQGLSELQNEDKSTQTGKVWGTTSDGAGWVDAPQGGIISWTRLSSGSCNDLTESGYYYVLSTVSERPADSKACYIWAGKSGANLFQFAVDYSTGESWTRVAFTNGGVLKWKNWLSHTANVSVTDDYINSLIDAKLTPLEALADEILEVM